MSDRLSCIWIDDECTRALRLAQTDDFARAVDARVVESWRAAVDIMEAGFEPDLILLDVVGPSGLNVVDAALRTRLRSVPWILLSDRAKDSQLHDKRDVVCMSSHVVREAPMAFAAVVVGAFHELVRGLPAVSRSYLGLLVHNARRSVEDARFELIEGASVVDRSNAMDERLADVSSWLDRIVLQ